LGPNLSLWPYFYVRKISCESVSTVNTILAGNRAGPLVGLPQQVLAALQQNFGQKSNILKWMSPQQRLT